MLKTAVLVPILLLSLLTPSKAENSIGYTITVVADQSKVNGQPWDGLGAGNLGGRASVGLPTSGPPDLAICLVSIAGQSTCLDKKEKGRRYSLCQDSFDCDFEHVSLPRGLVGVIIVDIDMRDDDLVDFLILHTDDTATAEDTQRLERVMREQVALVSPTFTEGERQRRERKIVEINAWDCIEKECRLRQSKIQFKQVK